jgi:hypothetical protein
MHTLSASLESIDTATGVVEINGVDTQCPTTPFTWIWGDGSLSSGFFPQLHTYTDKNRNYVTRVVANYSGGGHDTVEMVVPFVPPTITPATLSPLIAVHVPSNSISLGSRLYAPPSNLTPFDSSFFSVLPRSTLEYILSVAATVQRDFVNDNTYLFNGTFEQYMLRDSSFGGAYSLWFTDPVSFGVGDAFMKGGIDYSSLFHEMGHNFTLNTPAGYYYGGNIDGEANAIFSESMAQIFQHATAYVVINEHQSFGLDDDVTCAIKQQAIRTIGFLRSRYDDYVNKGKPFASWNDPSTPSDETLGTFMTIAYKFCAHAESAGIGYRIPLKRMMRLLQGLCVNWSQRYDQLHNAAAADTFRSTLMVSALSYAFSIDLREEFRQLHFPVSDELYIELFASPTSVEGESDNILQESPCPMCFPNPFNPETYISFQVPAACDVKLVVFDLRGSDVATLVNERKPAGSYTARFDASGLASGVYFYRFRAGSSAHTGKMVLLR